MKKYFVILLSLLLVLSACGGDEPETNDEPIEDQWEDIMNETEDCPVCETCEVCEECEETECEQQSFGGEHIELWLDQLELYSTDQGSTEDVTVGKIESDEFDRLKSVTLRFTPACTVTDKLRVRWESQDLYEDKPVCGEEVSVPVNVGLAIGA